MFGRLWRRISVSIAMLLMATAAGAAEAPSRIHRIVAVGDLHGDYSAWQDIGRAAGLIDGQGHWAAGRTVFVQTGDVVDRGADSLKIITDLRRLQREAPRVGGRVITLVGNHEAMNLTDDLRYVSEGEFAAFATRDSALLRDQLYARNRSTIEASYRKRDPALTADAIRATWYAATPLGKIEHQSAWHPQGDIGRWVIGNPAVVMLDDTLFVHGGISATFARLSIAQINARVAAALTAQDGSDGAIINDPLGPLWYRGLITRDPDAEDLADRATATAQPSIEEELGQVLRAYGANRIVIGHTPVLGGIQILHDGRLVRIDTGISAFYGGTPSYLEILDGVPMAHDVPRTAPLRKGAQ